MDICSICDRSIEGPSLTDIEGGDEYHPACFARRVPEDAVVALISAMFLVLAPAIVVWAA